MTAKRVSIGYATSLLGIFTSLLNNLWLMREVALEVDKSDFGIYLLVFSIMGYFALSQLGLDLASSQRIAEALARKQTESACRVYRQLSWFNRIAFATVLTVSLIVASTLGWWLVEDVSLISRIVLLLATSIGFTMLANPATAVLSGSQNMHLVGGVRLACALGSTLLAFVLLQFGFGVLCLPAAQATMAVFRFCVMHALRRSFCPWTMEAVQDVWLGARGLFVFAAGVGVASVVNMVDSSTDAIMFKLVSDNALTDIANYNIWYRFPGMSLVVAMMLLNNAAPTLANTMERSQPEGLLLHRKLLWLASGIGACATVGLSVWLVPFVHHWMSGTYDLSSGQWVAVGMGTAIGFRALVSSLTAVCYPLDQVKLVIAGSAVLVVVKVLGAILFLSVSPVPGMAWANALGAACGAAFVGLRLRQQVNYDLRALLTAFFMVIGGAVVGAMLNSLMSDADLLTMIVGIVLTLAVLAAVYIYVIEKLNVFSLRKRIMALITSKESA